MAKKKSNGSNGKSSATPKVIIPEVDEDGIERPGEVQPAPAGKECGTRYLKCELTDQDILCLRVEREAEDERIEDLQGSLDRALEQAKSLKKQIEVLQEAGQLKSKTIRLGYEWRDVPCVERRGVDPREDALDGAEGVCTYRIDTGECIEWRELRADERQGALFDHQDTQDAAQA